MKNHKFAVSALLSVLLLPVSVQSFAAEAAESLDDCQAIQDRLARYACYDRWDAASGAIRPSAPRATTTPAQPQEEADTSLFGRVFDRDSDDDAAAAQVADDAAPTTMDSFGRPQSDPRLVEGNVGSELIDTVAALERSGPSMWRVTLSSGQEWQQMITKRYPLAVGDEVRIYPTRWGSAYRLTSEKAGSYIQVKRVDGGANVAVDAPVPAPQAAAVQREETDEPGLLGRMGTRIGGIFSRDDEATEAPQVASGQDASEAGEQSVEGFGRAPADARLVEGDEGSELIDTVAALEQSGPSMWRVTLASGQRWQQMISKRYPLSVGDEVRIYPTRWGNAFRLTSKAGGYIQVQRVD